MAERYYMVLYAIIAKASLKFIIPIGILPPLGLTENYYWMMFFVIIVEVKGYQTGYYLEVVNVYCSMKKG